jgi:hypothetical protein
MTATARPRVAAMTSHLEDGRRVETPHLNVEYAPLIG